MGASQQNYSGSCAPSIHPVSRIISSALSHMHMQCLGSSLFWLTKATQKENISTTESANLFTAHTKKKKKKVKKSGQLWFSIQ